MNSRIRTASYIAWRFYIVNVVILLLVGGLIVRLVYLSVFNQNFLLDKSNARILRTINTPAFRGMITDREGYPLAISTSVYSIWVDPKEYSSSEKLPALSHLIEIKPNILNNAINKNKDREFLYLKRGVSPELAFAIKKLSIPGIHLHEEFKRFYPEGEVTAHLVGFTNIDDKGAEGLELSYDSWLRGTAGKKKVIKDRLGREISEVQAYQNQKTGNNLVLSIDRRIQYLAYRELMKGVDINLASSGSVVVLNVKTGEILAMVNQPSYNPNKHNIQKKENLRNRAVTDLFEPGSTMKAFSVAVALNSGLFTPNTVIDTNPGWLRVGHNLIRDEHFKGALTVTQVLQVSSDVGVSKMILQLPSNALPNMLHQMGFGDPTGVGFPGERSGQLASHKVWKPIELATLSFGYGISITALQLARAYATLANNGVAVPLTLLKRDDIPQGKQVIDKKLAKQMVSILEAVLDKGGTAQKARVPGFHVSGKTGTAWVASAHGYDKHRYTSSFVGIAPSTNPQLVVAVVIHEPRGKVYYGGDVSAPVFEKIMEGTLRILDIPPDDSNLFLEKNAA